VSVQVCEINEEWRFLEKCSAILNGGGDGTDNQTKAGECGVVGHEPLES